MAGIDISLGTLLQKAWLWADSRAGWILLGGLIAAVALNGLLWRRDRACLERERRRASGQRAETPGIALSSVAQFPRVSVLLPAWNEGEYIRECLDSIRNLRYPNLELIVCAGGEDGTLDLARRYAPPTARILEQRPGEGKQGALRRSLEQATGSIIFLTDADCVLDDEVFEGTLYPLLVGQEQVTTGVHRPLDHQRENPLVAYQWFHQIYMQANLPKYTDMLEGVNAAISREALEAAGGFEGSAPIGTDYFLARRLRDAGYRIRCVPQSRVRTAYCTRLGEYGRQRSRWFRNRLIHGLRFRAWRDVRGHLWAGLTSLFMLAVPLTGGLGARWLWALWLAGLAHLLLSQIRVVRFAQIQIGARLPHWWQYGLFVLYMVFGWVATVRGGVEALFPGRRWKW